MFLELTNSQKLKKLDISRIKSRIDKAGDILDIADKRISVFFCGRQAITKINKKFFGRDEPTDVIAFPLGDDHEPGYLGEVVVSVEEAVKKCAEFGFSWQEELMLYIIHGILHLLGYDDRTAGKRVKMERKQKEVMEKLFG